MDKPEDRARKLISMKADFVGAIRLPDTAFKGNANTEVTTDIIILKKRAAGQRAVGEPWLGVKPLDTPEGQLNLNEYYHAHKDMMLGEMRLTGTMYRGGVPTLRGTSEGIRGKIKEAGLALPAATELAPAKPAITRPGLESSLTPGHVKEGAFFVDGDKLYRKESGAGGAVTMPKTDEAKVMGLIQLRESTRAVLQAQMEDRDPADITRLQKELGRKYDAFVKAHGPINRTKISTIQKGEKTTYQNRMPNFRPFRRDPDAFLVAALEVYDEETATALKAPIFTERVIGQKKAVAKVEDPAEAIPIVLNELGHLDMDRIAQLAGLERDATIEKLGPLV